MKTDYYLNLCLEQAAQSPLHYRHGCIIVRGGKVIGQGFNDYRSGFDGGALKTGVLPVRSLNPAALAELKKKHKHKSNSSEEATTFTPFEATGGGGKLANTPLSMHSEMMAIHSALSTSSTLVSTSVSSQKPYLKLSGDSKRKARLQRDAVKTYVEAICKLALAQSTKQHLGRPFQPSRFEGAAFKSDVFERGAASDARSCVSRAYRGQYGETPRGDSDEPPTRERSTQESRTSETTAPAVCA